MYIVFVYGLALLCANIVHQMLVIPRAILLSLAIPIDGGLRMHGAPILGLKKTFRGFVTVSILTAFFAPIGTVFVSSPSALHCMITGLFVGTAYMLGELPNSFIKRRIGIAESMEGSGASGAALRILNHTDSVFAAVLMLYFLEKPSIQDLLIFFIIGSMTHAWINIFLYRAGYKTHVPQKKNRAIKPATTGTLTLSVPRTEIPSTNVSTALADSAIMPAFISLWPYIPLR